MNKKWLIPLTGLLVLTQASAQVSPPADVGGALTPEQKERFSAADPEDITNENFPELIESFDFPNADLSDVVQAISELTGKNFIIDPGLRGKITIIAPTQITVAEAYRAFLSALAINGFTVVPSGRFLKIKSARNAQRDSIETYTGDYFPDTDQMITRIIHLKHITAAQVNRDLRILPSKEGEIAVYEPTNSIIMSDYGSNIERVMTILNQLDVPGFEEQMEVVPIEHATAKDIAALVDQIVNKDSDSGGARGGAAGRPSSFRSRFSRGGGPAGDSQAAGASFNVISDDRTNSLIVVGNRAGISKITKLIKQLDFKLDPNASGGVYVYYVKHGEAEKIAQTLSGVAEADAGDQRGAPPRGGRFTPPAQQAQDVFGGEVKITASEDTNSLIIVASRQDYDSVLNLLGKIDIPRDQVFVEAIIMELGLEDQSKFGVGYYNFQDGTEGIGRQGFNGLSNIGELLASPFAGSGTILGFSTGSKVTIPVAGQDVTVGSLTGLINFLKGNARTNVLSTPQIMALDNEEATIEVGEKVPVSFTTQQNQNGTTTQSANFEDATIKLTIKPFISPSTDSVRMEIDQSIKLPKGEPPQNLTQQAVTLSTRSVKTNIVVPNGDTAVLGGLMRDDSIETVTKVPILGDIPILGWLFKSNSYETRKVNLLIFLSPKIVRNAGDSKRLLSDKLEERLKFVKKAGGQDPYGESVEAIRAKAEANNLPAVEDEAEEFNF